MRKRTIRHFTIISDLILLNVAFAVAYMVRYEWQWLSDVPTEFYEPFSHYFGQQLVLNLLLILTYAHNKVWQRRRGEFWIDELSRIIYATGAGMTLMVVVTFFVQPTPFSRLMILWAFLFIVGFIGLGRLGRRMLLLALYRRGRMVDRALVVGAGETGRGIIRTMLARPDLGFKTIGYLQVGAHEQNVGLGRIPHLGLLEDLPHVLAGEKHLHTVFIALPGDMHQQTAQVAAICQQYGVRAQVVPDLLQLSLNRVEFNNMAGIPLLSVRDVGISHAQRFLKRLLDLTVVLVGAVPALLATAVIAIAIKRDSPGPIIYAAERVGRNGKPFKMYKFRSMIIGAEEQKEALRAYNEADGPIFKMKDDPRQTKVGRFLRRSSLDELPQLYNVFLGQMSLVGPRPPLQEEVAQYKAWHMQRLSVIGGVTGLWQVSGRSDLTFDELCLLDIYYIENWSLGMDIRILLQTIPRALFGAGAY